MWKTVRTMLVLCSHLMGDQLVSIPYLVRNPGVGKRELVVSLRSYQSQIGSLVWAPIWFPAIAFLENVCLVNKKSVLFL